MPSIFLNSANRLRSGWRLIIFLVAFFAVFAFLRGVVQLAGALISSAARERTLALMAGSAVFLVQTTLLLVVAILAGWLCGRALEGLPLRALGWARHQGWLRDLARGIFVGGGSLLFAAFVITLSGGFSFSLNDAGGAAILRTLVVSGIIFTLGAAAEEALFRGYMLQTLLRSHPLLLAALPGSILFALGHLGNPNVAPGWTLINTALAGVWLAVAYWKTRSLWFPLGVHWAWNYVMASVLGIPVSGITSIAPQPLLRATETGADWFTGGSYGIEGGVACTLALVISSIFIWRTRLLHATEEMRAFTDAEQPPTSARKLTAVGDAI